MYQFMYLPLEKSDLLDFPMTNGSKLDIYNYRITPDQSVTVPLGTFKALYVASVPEAGEPDGNLAGRRACELSLQDGHNSTRMAAKLTQGPHCLQHCSELQGHLY